MYQNILFPTDGSKSVERAFQHVQDLAETYDATVHVLSVYPITHEGLGGDPDKERHFGMIGHPEKEVDGMGGNRKTAEEMRELRKTRAEAVAQETADHFEGIDTEAIVEGGVAHQVILDHAENDIDLIVMGTHGRTGVDRYVLGSVAEKVVRLSDVPVMTVRQEAE